MVYILKSLLFFVATSSFKFVDFYSIQFGSHFKLMKKYLEILKNLQMEFCEYAKVVTLFIVILNAESIITVHHHN